MAPEVDPEPIPDLMAYAPDGTVMGRVTGWIGGTPVLVDVLEDDEPEPEWFEDEEGYVRAPLSYENREGDPAFNGAFSKW